MHYLFCIGNMPNTSALVVASFGQIGKQIAALIRFASEIGDKITVE